MAQLQKGHTYNPGDVVDAADLNALVDSATALEGIISAQAVESPLLDTSQVIVRTATGFLKKRAVSTLPSGVTSVGLAATPTPVVRITSTTGNPITTTGSFTVEIRQQGGNKVLCTPVDGSTGDVLFRALVPADITPPTVAVAAYEVDWDLGNVFDKTWPDGVTRSMTFSNIMDGQTITVRIRQAAVGGARVNWPGTVIWNEGAEPDMTTAPNGYGIYVFTAVKHGGVTTVHGYLESSTGYVTGVSATATPTSVFGISVTNPTTAPAIALSLDQQSAGKFLAGPISGADAVPAFRVLSPADMPSATVSLGSGLNIDWSLGNCFTKSLPVSGSVSMTFSNPTEGQTITVLMNQGGAPGTTTVSWPGAVFWAGGTPHPMTTGAGAHDILVFRYIGAHYYGNYLLNFS